MTMAGTPEVAGWSAYLDERVDQIVIEEQKIFPVRMLLTLAAGSILATHVGVDVAALTVSLLLACELFEQILIRPLLRGGSFDERRRLLYLLATAAISVAWVMPPIFLWSTGRVPLQFIAILSLNAQMIHGQAFMFRSPLALVIGTAIPAITMLVLPVVYSDIAGMELSSLLLTCGSTIGYVMYSAHLNVVSTRTIERSRSAFRDLANTDPMTGLANRRRFTELLREAVSSSESDGRQFGLLLIDLDKFKSINDTVGHDAGDAVLVEAAERLRQAVGGSGSVARLGGDEFGIILPGTARAMASVCDRIVAAFGPPIIFAGSELRTASSIGAARCPEDATTDDTLFKCADLALYDAKRAGGGRWAGSVITQGRIVDHHLGSAAA